MRADHLELLVEEPSMEAFLRVLLPRLLPSGTGFGIYPFQGKRDLLAKLPSRLKAYANWLPRTMRIVVLVDCDCDPCEDLKRELEDFALGSGLRTRSRRENDDWQLVNRIVVEELEGWYLADWEAVKAAYPRVPKNAPRCCNDPDAIAGGTWEAFERLLRRHGYFRNGLRKIEVAEAIAPFLDPERSTSPSFRHFHRALVEATEDIPESPPVG